MNRIHSNILNKFLQVKDASARVIGDYFNNEEKDTPYSEYKKLVDENCESTLNTSEPIVSSLSTTIMAPVSCINEIEDIDDDNKSTTIEAPISCTNKTEEKDSDDDNKSTTSSSDYYVPRRTNVNNASMCNEACTGTRDETYNGLSALEYITSIENSMSKDVIPFYSFTQDDKFRLDTIRCIVKYLLSKQRGGSTPSHREIALVIDCILNALTICSRIRLHCAFRSYNRLYQPFEYSEKIKYKQRARKFINDNIKVAFGDELGGVLINWIITTAWFKSKETTTKELEIFHAIKALYSRVYIHKRPTNDAFKSLYVCI